MTSKITKEVILHIGLHKTATSSIQATLDANRVSLSRFGLTYTYFCDKSGSRMANHSVPMYSLFCDDPAQYRMNKKNGWDPKITNDLFEKQLSTQLNDSKRLLISGEAISALNRNGLIRVKEYFVNCKIRVIVVVRDAYSFQSSAIQELVKQGRDFLTEPKVIKNSNKIERIKEVFDDVEFYSFEEACKFEGGPVRYFLNLINVNTPAIKVKQSNEGLSFHSVKLLNFVNTKVPEYVDGQINPDRAYFKPSKITFDKQKFFLTKEEISVLLDDIENENLILEELTGLKLQKLNHKCEPIKSPTHWNCFCVTVYAVSQPKMIRKYINEYLVLNGYIHKSLLRAFYIVSWVLGSPSIALNFAKVTFRNICKR